MRLDDPRHGTTAGYSAHYTDGEPVCYACRVAKANYTSQAYRQKAYGRWNAWTDSEPARAHVRALMDGGATIRQIAAAAGVPYSRISHLLYGNNGYPPPPRIRPHYAEKILAANTGPARYPTFTITRRLQALVAIGYSGAYLADRLGWSLSRVDQFLKVRHLTEQVMADTYQKVDALYLELHMTPRVGVTRGERQSVTRALNTARRYGWRPPLHWDEIDDEYDRSPGRPRKATA